MSPEHAAKTAKEAAAQGYALLKMKATYDDRVVERLQAIYDAVGDKLHPLFIDPNQRFKRPARLFGVIEQVEGSGYTVQCFESPFDHGNLDWYVLARQKMNTPLALHLGDPGR